MPEVELELLPVVVAAIFPMILGAVWYSPIAFGNMWMQYAGVTKKDAEEMNPAFSYGLTFIFAIVLSVMLSYFLTYATIDTNMEAVQAALMVWVGFSVAFGLPAQVFSKNHWGTFFIYQGYQLVNVIAMSLILINL